MIKKFIMAAIIIAAIYAECYTVNWFLDVLYLLFTEIIEQGILDPILLLLAGLLIIALSLVTLYVTIMLVIISSSLIKFLYRLED